MPSFGGILPASAFAAPDMDWSSIGNFGALDPNSIGGGTEALGVSAPSFAQTNVPGMAMPTGAGGVWGTGMNGFQLGRTAVDGLQTIGALWSAWQQNKMAKKQFKFSRDMALTNLANTVKSYNTALADRARSRGVMEGQSQSQVDGYVKDNSLSTKR